MAICDVVDSTYQALVESITENEAHFYSDESEAGQRLHFGLGALKDGLQQVAGLVKPVRDAAPSFDFSPEVPGNGFRSLCRVCDAAMQSVYIVVTKMAAARGGLVFRKTHFVREVEAWTQALGALVTVLEFANSTLLPQCTVPDGDLITPHCSHAPLDLIHMLSNVPLHAFYGRCLGFHYVQSLSKTFHLLTLSLSAFSEAYYSGGNMWHRTRHSIVAGSQYLLSPEQRARRLVTVLQYGSVAFIKCFWDLAETEVMRQLPSLVSPPLAVLQHISVPCEEQTVPVHPAPGGTGSVPSGTGPFVTIPPPSSHIPPAPISCYLLSTVWRQGMPGSEAVKKSLVHPPSPHLLLHCHGGGFVAQSTRSQEMFLREWAAGCGCPVLSVDYSLAPDAPYPRPLEEALTAYCWALSHLPLLGSTGSTVVLTGDSAGGNLVTGVTLRCLQLGVRPPDGLFLAYTPFMLRLLPSPARLLAVLDPMLPLSFALRCLKAYAGHDSIKSPTEVMPPKKPSASRRAPPAGGRPATGRGGSCPTGNDAVGEGGVREGAICNEESKSENLASSKDETSTKDGSSTKEYSSNNKSLSKGETSSKDGLLRKNETSTEVEAPTKDPCLSNNQSLSIEGSFSKDISTPIEGLSSKTGSSSIVGTIPSSTTLFTKDPSAVRAVPDLRCTSLDDDPPNIVPRQPLFTSDTSLLSADMSASKLCLLSPSGLSEADSDTLTTVSLTSDVSRVPREGLFDVPREELDMSGDPCEKLDLVGEMQADKEERSRRFVSEFLEKYVLVPGGMEGGSSPGSENDGTQQSPQEGSPSSSGAASTSTNLYYYHHPGEAGRAITQRLGAAKEAVVTGLTSGLSSVGLPARLCGLGGTGPSPTPPCVPAPGEDEDDVPYGVGSEGSPTSPEPAELEGPPQPPLGGAEGRTLLEEFSDVTILDDPFLNSLEAPRSLLSLFPPTSILTVEYDFCLDDGVCMARLLRSLGVSVTLDVLQGLPHGFLNLCCVAKETKAGVKTSVDRIKALLGVDRADGP